MHFIEYSEIVPSKKLNFKKEIGHANVLVVLVFEVKASEVANKLNFKYDTVKLVSSVCWL